MASKHTKEEAFVDLVKAQSEIGVVFKSEDNPYFKSKYADINGMLAVVKKPLNDNGWAILQALTTVDGRLGLRTILIHESGEKLEDYCPLPECPDAQKYGSAITYFRRYALQSILALQAQDDDANIASNKVIAPAVEVKPFKKGKSTKTVSTVPYPVNESEDIPFETEDEKKLRIAKDAEKKAKAGGDEDLDFIGQ